jgi:RNA polymerase sigma factor (sigma-70 family)
MQNGLIEAYFCLGNLKNKNSFKHSLGGIVSNTCKRYLRDNSKKYLSLKQYYEEFHDSEVIDEEKIVEIILGAIRSLEPKNGKIVVDYYYEDKSIQEISEENFISPALVKVRLHRARKVRWSSSAGVIGMAWL